MVFEKIRLTDIKPSTYNPRTITNNEYSKLTRSIQDFGLVDPIIINLKNNKIIGGHQRYNVLLDEYASNNENFEELNLIRLGDIGWAFPTTDLTIESDEHEKTLNILLNQNNLMGEWDNKKLNTVLQDLNEVDFDLSLTGFEDYEIDLYLDDEYEKFEYTFTEENNVLSNDSNQEENIEDEDELPSDYMDVTGTTANKSYVISIGFNDQETANKFLKYINYHRRMTRDTLQFMFTELEWDLDKLLEENQEKKTLNN